MTHSEYLVNNFEACKKLALSSYNNKGYETQIRFLNEFKERNKSVINSNRTYEYIHDLETLFDVLEKRNALTPTDIHVLEYIYEVLKISKKILETHNAEIKREAKKTIGGGDTENHAPNQSKASFHYQQSSEITSPEKEYPNRQILSERVIVEISTRVGASWESLARYLKVQECEIHKISEDRSLRSYEAKIRAMLKVFEKRSLPEEVKIKLLKALRLCGRMDIQEDVEKLFLRET